MKVPESGMPEEQYWESLFDIPLILDCLKIDHTVEHVAELGCGYGTFTLPVARRIQGIMFTFDIERAMVDRTVARAENVGVRNINASLRDVVATGFGLEPECCDAVLLFNILHLPQPEALIRQATEILRPAGRILAIHWRSDIPTPRGPSKEIRPRPEQIAAWAEAAGGLLLNDGPVGLPPYHYGMAFTRLPTLTSSDERP